MLDRLSGAIALLGRFELSAGVLSSRTFSCPLRRLPGRGARRRWRRYWEYLAKPCSPLRKRYQANVTNERGSELAMLSWLRIEFLGMGGGDKGRRRAMSCDDESGGARDRDICQTVAMRRVVERW